MAVVWEIVALDSTKTVGSLSDVVTNIHWTAKETDGEYVGSLYGDAPLQEADSKSFTAYDSLKKDDVILWLKSALGAEKVKEIEDKITEQITLLKTPKVITGLPADFS